MKFIIIIPHTTTYQQVCGPKKILYKQRIIESVPKGGKCNSLDIQSMCAYL